MDGQIDSAVIQLREILKSAPKPDKLNDHPWVKCLFVQHYVKGNRLLEKRRSGYQLASAVAAILMELQPERPPESQKEKSRLNARWARFATLGAYFAPLLIEGSPAAPVTVTDIGARINETIVELVTGKAFDEANETTRTKYRLIYVPEHVSDAPVSRSTLNDWLQQGLTELAGRVLQREEELSLKHDQPSPLLDMLKKEPASDFTELLPQTVEPLPPSPALEEAQHSEEKKAARASIDQQPPPVEPAPISPPTQVNQPSGTDENDLPSVPLDNFVLVDWWVRETFRKTELASDGAGQTDKARRLAEYLAAIQLRIESGVEPTPRLVRQNVQRALRGIGLELGRDNTGDLIVALLERSNILGQVDNCWEFTNPNLVDYFGARYISEYGQHWVSLRPQHRRLMQWTAACLARRGDDERTRLFVVDVKRALSQVSDLSWLEVADLLAEFSRDCSPAIEQFRTELSEALRRLAAVNSSRLRCSVVEKSSRLGLDIGLTALDESVEEVIPATVMENAANELGLATLLSQIGITKSSVSDSTLLEDADAVRALLEHLQKLGEEFQFPCAAWLRRSSLQTTISYNVDLKALWKSGAVSALEVIAGIANDSQLDAFTRTLARSILTRDDFIARLWVLGDVHTPLVYTLLLIMDKRLFFQSDTGEWLVSK